ncbi:50S ribosomal protein L11, partial [Candidatus Woesebacteria bacterium]|nr:50S ribosomal protein L11 [Candidatus Woesebacteria bacterium]
DNSFTFVLKLPPVSDMIKQAIKLKQGASKTGTEVVGTLPMDKARVIAEQKLADLNCSTVDAALKMIIGSARSMGVEVK